MLKLIRHLVLPRKCFSTLPNIGSNVVPEATEDSETTTDIHLLRVVSRESNATDQWSSLAGDPRGIDDSREEKDRTIRPDVLVRWNDRPQLDADKEWTKFFSK